MKIKSLSCQPLTIFTDGHFTRFPGSYFNHIHNENRFPNIYSDLSHVTNCIHCLSSSNSLVVVFFYSFPLLVKGICDTSTLGRAVFLNPNKLISVGISSCHLLWLSHYHGKTLLHLFDKSMYFAW